MANQSWKIWLIPFGLWGLYLCWYSGYQSGYADGHETAWSMSRPSLIASASDTAVEFSETAALEDADTANR